MPGPIVPWRDGWDEAGVRRAGMAWGLMEHGHRQSSRAGGAILAFTIIAGALIGNHFGQPSIGMLAGTGIGVAIAVGLYLLDRRK